MMQPRFGLEAVALEAHEEFHLFVATTTKMLDYYDARLAAVQLLEIFCLSIRWQFS
jgi:hypothetical protein